MKKILLVLCLFVLAGKARAQNGNSGQPLLNQVQTELKDVKNVNDAVKKAKKKAKKVNKKKVKKEVQKYLKD